MARQKPGAGYTLDIRLLFELHRKALDSRAGPYTLDQIPLDAEILSRTPPEVIELILSLLERIRVLEARVVELEAKLNQNSSNSNKPPSSDPPFVKRPEVAKKSKKPRKRRGMC